MDSARLPHSKRLVQVALTVILTYCVIVFLLACFASKAAAGIVGPALTLLLSLMLTRLEARHISAPSLNIWHFILLLFAFTGIQWFGIVVFILGLRATLGHHLMDSVVDVSDFFSLVSGSFIGVNWGAFFLDRPILERQRAVSKWTQRP